MQRRSLFKLGLVSATVLLVAGGGAALLKPGLDKGALTAEGREIFSAVGRAVLDNTLPTEQQPRLAALEGLVQRVDVLIRALPPHAQAELSQLLGLLGSSPGRQWLAGLHQPWAQASVAELQSALQAMRHSGLAIRQQAYGALHDIAAGAYFSDPSSWSVLGYPGPLKI